MLSNDVDCQANQLKIFVQTARDMSHSGDSTNSYIQLSSVSAEMMTTSDTPVTTTLSPNTTKMSACRWILCSEIAYSRLVIALAVSGYVNF